MNNRTAFTKVVLCTVCSITSMTGLGFAAAANQSLQDHSQSAPTQADASQPEVPTRLLQGQASTYGAFGGALNEELQSRMGFKSAANELEDVIVTEVVPKTPAFEAGLKKGDRLLDAKIDGNALDITIDRNGKLFNARLRAHAEPPPVLMALQAKMDETKRKPFTLGAQQIVIPDNELVPEKANSDKTPMPLAIDAKRFSLHADQNAKLLAKYNLEFIVDRSESMGAKDCPNGMSRWGWCGQQAAQLAQSMTPYTPNGLTIVPFATEYDVFEHATANNIDQMFNGIHLQNGTRLFEPITERLDDYLIHHKPSSKPLLIVVITDGVPFPKFEPALVRNSLIEASHKMVSPNEVSVIFCQIGDRDRFGKRYLADLEANLKTYGARYNYVHVIPFDVLSENGLGPSLVASINQYAPMDPPTVSPTAPKGKVKAVIAKPGSTKRGT